MVAFYATELGIMPERCLVFVSLWFVSIQKIDLLESIYPDQSMPHFVDIENRKKKVVKDLF